MTLQKLLIDIGQIGIAEKIINFSCAGGSIYELNSLNIRNYPLLYASPTGSHTVEESTTTYEITLFYLDRLLEDSSNDINIYSTAVEAIKNLVNKIRKIDGVLDVDDNYRVVLFTETERLSDRCSGAYATIQIITSNLTPCGI